MLLYIIDVFVLFFFKQKTAYEMRISDWSSDVCSSDLPDPDLDAVRAGIDQCARRLGRGDVAGNDLHRIGQLLDPLDRAGDLAVMAVRGIDDDEIDLRIDQRRGPPAPFLAAGGCRRHTPAPAPVRGGLKIGRARCRGKR